jgi:hypothetical protein
MWKNIASPGSTAHPRNPEGVAILIDVGFSSGRFRAPKNADRNSLRLSY